MITNRKSDSHTDESNKSVTGQSKRHLSRAGYWFDEDTSIWALDKNNTVYLSKVQQHLDESLFKAFHSTLIHYARTMSGAHTRNICDRFSTMLEVTQARSIKTSTLIEYRSQLNRATEWKLGTIRGFLYKWHELGYPGISDEVIDLLDNWSLKGNIKGDAVKRMSPESGPLTDNELRAFNEGVVCGFEQNKISLGELTQSLLISHTGRRPKQISHIKICDLDGSKFNKKEEPMYLIHIPRAKQRGEVFRNSFKTFAMTFELWAVLDAQRKNAVTEVEKKLGFELQESDRRQLPLFPDLDSLNGINAVVALRSKLETDQCHMKSAELTETLKKAVRVAKIHSERTGELLSVVATRFRYTKGTRAAREGFGNMVIAELLDHTDIQNVSVYTQNVPEHAQALNKAMALQLAPYAQAFQGVLVDREQDAKRGDDLNSRIKYKGKNTATCGQHGFCGANAPIPCYTCNNFQPWLDGPHEEVLYDLIAEREEVERITKNSTMAAVNDRTIFAVINVIQRCETRRSELAQNNGSII